MHACQSCRVHDIRAVQLFNLPVLPSLDALTQNLPEVTPTPGPDVDIPRVPEGTASKAAPTAAQPGAEPRLVGGGAGGSAFVECRPDSVAADDGVRDDHLANSGTSGGSSQIHVTETPSLPTASTATAADGTPPAPPKAPAATPGAAAPAALMQRAPAMPFFVAAFPDPCMGYIPVCLQPRSQQDREAAKRELQSRRERFRTKKALQRQRRDMAVRYVSRKVYADSRPRVNGRFIPKAGPVESEGS